MAANMSDAKHHARDLLDQLGPGQLAAVVHLLETMVSPDEDGDSLSSAERKAVAEADEWLKHNQPIPHEEVLAEFGLDITDWEKMGREPLPEETPRRLPGNLPRTGSQGGLPLMGYEASTDEAPAAATEFTGARTALFQS